jgi:nicotinate-nucleotide--dimethylbenzimidazole phosphoribosyltransferase
LETGLPFDDIRRLASTLPPGNEDLAESLGSSFRAARGESGDLGDLERLAIWLARWSGRQPAIRQPLVAVFAGTHGFALDPARPHAGADAVMAVDRMASGRAPVAALCSDANLGLKVFDLALDIPTGDFRRSDALAERDCAATIAFGMESIAGGVDLVSLADLGGDSRQAAEAVLHGLEGAAVEDAPAGAVSEALAYHGRRLSDPLEALRRVGGREVAAIAGAIVAARIEHIPAILDGMSAIAAAAVLHALHPGAVDHCLLAQPPAVEVAARATSRMGLFAVTALSLDAPGVAGTLAIGHVRAAALVAQRIAPQR